MMRAFGLLVGSLAAVAILAATIHSATLTNPAIIGGSTAFGGASHDDDAWGFGSQRVFDNDIFTGYDTYYSGNGTGVGTFLDFDFGYAKTIGGLSHINNSTLDGITQSKLIFSDDAVFDASDTVVTLDHITSSEMSSNEFRFDAVTAQYVRWEVTGISGGDTYQGSRYLRFHDDQEQGRLSMAMIGNHSEFNTTTYNAIHAYDGIQSNLNYKNEWASQGGGTDTYLDFDFGTMQDVGGMELWQRTGDYITAADLIFSDTPDFSNVIATKSVTLNEGDRAHTSITLDATVNARYVRIDATSTSGGGPNVGLANVYFTEPGTAPFETAATTFITPAVQLATSEWVEGRHLLLLTNNALSENSVNGVQPASNLGTDFWHAGPVSGGLEGGETGDPAIVPVVADQALVYDFRVGIDLDSVYIWNMTQTDSTSRGVKDVEVYVSTDNDLSTWTSVGVYTLDETSNPAGERAQLLRLNQTGVQAIKFDILTAQSGEVNDYVGLSKIRFAIDKPLESDPNILRPAAVTASSVYGENYDTPQRLINGSGFQYPDLELASAAHVSDRDGAGMWHSGKGEDDEPLYVADQFLIFDLGANYDIAGALVWQMSQFEEGVLDLTGRGVDEFDIYLSTDDNPETWTLYSTEHLAKSSELTSELAQEISILASNVRMVKFDIQSCHSGLAQDYVGLSEVRFLLAQESPAIPGDANRDGKVDGSDVTILAGNWQVLSGADWGMGDFNGDGKVDGSDVTILAGNWQSGVTTAAAAVPEPSTLVLLLGGLLCLLIRRRR